MKSFICPVCQGDLQETSRHGILIDTCTRCRGVWLDRGELEKLSAAMGPPREGGFLGGALSAFGGDRYRKHDDDDDHHHRDHRHHGKAKWKRKKSLLDFFD